MKRGKNIFIVCHCLLNSNAKIYPLADTKGVYKDDIMPLIMEGVGLVQLPCPETCYLGMSRWGMTKEQYDHQAFRDFCKRILHPVLLQITAYTEAGYIISGVAGMDGSPNCGITKTCIGYRGGEICSGNVKNCSSDLQMVAERGVFMEILEELLRAEGITPPFVSLHQETSG
jgi:predicted secreted protein